MKDIPLVTPTRGDEYVSDGRVSSMCYEASIYRTDSSYPRIGRVSSILQCSQSAQPPLVSVHSIYGTSLPSDEAHIVKAHLLGTLP